MAHQNSKLDTVEDKDHDNFLPYVDLSKLKSKELDALEGILKVRGAIQLFEADKAQNFDSVNSNAFFLTGVGNGNGLCPCHGHEQVLGVSTEATFHGQI